MSNNYLDIIRDMKAGKLAPLYLLHGEEDYFIDQIVEYVENNILTEAEKSFNFTVMYGKDSDPMSVTDVARRYPMMAERQVLILKEAQNMLDLSELEKYFLKPTPTTLFVLCYKHKKMDMRKTFAKAIKKNGVVFESKKIYEDKMAGWISSYLSSKGYGILPEASELIAEYLGNKLSKVTNELDKLILNVPKKSKINITQVQDYVGINKEYNVFELQSALADRNALKANRIIKYFEDNPKAGPIPYLIGALYSFFSKLYMTYFTRNATNLELRELLGFRTDWFLKDYKLARMRFSKSETERNIALLREYDLKSKGVDSDNVTHGELLKELIYKIIH